MFVTTRSSSRALLTTEEGKGKTGNEVITLEQTSNSSQLEISQSNQKSAEEKPTRFDNLILDIKQCSEFTGIPIGTLYKLTSQRKIPHSKIGKKVMFLKDEIIAWIKSKRVEVSP
jgi:excisionase family DNA binding protein